MNRGISKYTANYFVEQNELRRRGEAPYVGKKANTVFRKTVLLHVIDHFGITVAAAAKHYNDALRLVREATPELVAGLGRPEDKKGGRRPRSQPQAVAQHLTQEETVALLLESNILSPHVQAEEEELQALAASSVPQGWDKIDTSVEADFEEAPF
jgi:hypothetical protein